MMRASVVGWRAPCAAWGEPARPGLPRRGNGKGEIKFLAPQADSDRARSQKVTTTVSKNKSQ